MSTASIIENAFFANGRYWGRQNESLQNHGSIWTMKTGIDSADLNMVWNEQPLRPEDSGLVQNIKEDYQKDGLPFWWWIFPGGNSPETLSILDAEGFSLITRVPSMLTDLSLMPDREPYDAMITVSRVTTREDLHLWEEVSFAGFDFPPETKEPYHRFVNGFHLHADSPQKFFLAYLDGQPVATALLFLNHNVAGIYFVTTLAGHRKKGIGLALTLETLYFAKMAGVRYATLQSSSDGLQVYRKAGFQEYLNALVYSL